MLRRFDQSTQSEGEDGWVIARVVSRATSVRLVAAVLLIGAFLAVTGLAYATDGETKVRLTPTENGWRMTSTGDTGSSAVQGELRVRVWVNGELVYDNTSNGSGIFTGPSVGESTTDADDVIEAEAETIVDGEVVDEDRVTTQYSPAVSPSDQHLYGSPEGTAQWSVTVAKHPDYDGRLVFDTGDGTVITRVVPRGTGTITFDLSHFYSVEPEVWWEGAVIFETLAKVELFGAPEGTGGGGGGGIWTGSGGGVALC